MLPSDRCGYRHARAFRLGGRCRGLFASQEMAAASLVDLARVPDPLTELDRSIFTAYPAADWRWGGGLANGGATGGLPGHPAALDVGVLHRRAVP
eukprot:4417906-Pyramimonas_sp.AAC.1